jgi:hypothetical protein
MGNMLINRDFWIVRLAQPSHSRAGGNPGDLANPWIPACAGMTLQKWLKISGNQKAITIAGRFRFLL